MQFQDQELDELLDWIDRRNQQIWDKPLQNTLDFSNLNKLLDEEEAESDGSDARPVFEWTEN
jgi:hypothetical protein